MRTEILLLPQAKFVAEIIQRRCSDDRARRVGNPWLFQSMERVVETGSDRQEPSLSEKCGVILQHIRDIHQFYGEEKGYRIARKHVAWYLQGIQPNSVFRQTFNAISDATSQLMALEDFLI